MYQYRYHNGILESGQNMFIKPKPVACKVCLLRKSKNNCFLARSNRGSVKGKTFGFPLTLMRKTLRNLDEVQGRNIYCF